MFTSLRFAFVVAAGCALAAATPISVESTSPSTPRLELPRAIEGLLRSGLRVVVAPRADTEVVAIRLAIRGGASVEDESGRGAALAAVATLAKFEPAGFGALEKNGVVVEHDAALDRVELSIVAPKADLERALKALATALAQCKFEDADVARGKAVIAKASLDAVTLARKAALDATFTRAEANRGVDVDLAREVSGAAVRKYALAHVRSATAVLAISGDLDPGATFHLAREAFEPWERTRQPAFERVVEPSRTAGPTRAIVESERGRALAILWPILDRDSEETGAIRVVAELLRARHPEAHVALDESLGGAGRLVVSRSFEGDGLEPANEFERAALGFAAALDPATLDLAPAREALALALARDLATAEGVAARMARDGAELEDLRASEREFAALSRLDAARVVAVARKRLDPSRAVSGLAAPVQRGAVSTVDAIARGKIENGPSYVVDRRSGTGLVSVALRVPSSALPRSLGSIAHNAACGALLAEIAVESGAAGEIDLAFDESECSIAFDVSPSRAETALRAIFASFRGEDPSAAVIERARKRAADAIAARRRTVIDAVYEHGLGGGPEFLDRATGGDAPLAKLSALNLAPAMRAVDASLAIVGDFDPSRCVDLAGTLPAGPEAFSVGKIDPSAAPPRPSSFTGTTAGKNAILGKCFELEASPQDDSRALAALEANSELLAELRDFGFAPATAPRALHLARRAAYSPAFGAKRWLVVALEVAPSDLDSARASFDALLDALAKRGVTKDDLAAAKKAVAKAAFARSRTTRGQARALLESDTQVSEPDSEKATALLRKSLASSSPFVILEPKEPAPGPRPTTREVDESKDEVAAVPPKTPSAMTLSELEAKFGKNLLEPDPAAAGRSGAPTPAQEIDVLRRWYGDPPGSLNMAVAGGDSNVVDSLCEYVAFGFGQRHDKDPGKWAPGVADYASWSDDHRVVTVRIRGDVTWQFPAVDRADPKYGWLVKRFAKGAPKLTAHDVAFTYRVFMDPGAVAGGLRGAYAGSSLRLLDDRTYQVTWEEPTTMSFVYSLNLQTVLPEFLFSRDESGVPFPAELLGKGVLEHWYNNRMCGYGPYEFVRMEPNERIVLKRKDDFPVYRPAVKELRWEILKDPEQVVQRMLQGSLDAITLQPQQYKQYWLDAEDGEGVRRKDLRAIPYLRAEYFFIGWNTRRPQLADPIVRRALAHAVNRAAIIDRAFLGAAELVDGPFRREHPHRLELESPAFDTDEAGALLESAGWKDADNNGVLEKHIDGKDVEFRIAFTSFAGSAEGDMIAAVLKSDFEKLGIVLDVITLPWPQMREAVFRKHDYDCYLGVWGTAYEVDLRAMFHSRNAIDGLNYGGYSNPRIDAIADEYVHEFDPAKRLALAHEFQRVMRDDPPYAFLLRRERMTVVRDWLDGVEYSPYRPQLLSLSWRKKSE